MAIITTGSNPQNLRPGIRMNFGMSYKEWPTKYDQLFDIKIPDARAYEEDVMQNTLGLAKVKPQGSAVQYDNGGQLYTTRYPHIQYGLGFIITEEAFEDGVALKLGLEYSKNLKLNMLRTRETIAANVYNNAFTSTILMQGGDGVCLGSNAHVTAGANFSNVPTSAASMTEASLEQMVIDVQNYTDNRGLKILCVPDRLVVGLNLQFTVERIIGNKTARPATADRDINAMAQMNILPGGVVVDPYITSTTNWHVRTNQGGMSFFNRKDIVMRDENEFDTENAKFKGQMRFSCGWSDPRSVYCVNS